MACFDALFIVPIFLFRSFNLINQADTDNITTNPPAVFQNTTTLTVMYLKSKSEKTFTQQVLHFAITATIMFGFDMIELKSP